MTIKTKTNNGTGKTAAAALSQAPLATAPQTVADAPEFADTPVPDSDTELEAEAEPTEATEEALEIEPEPVTTLQTDVMPETVRVVTTSAVAPLSQSDAIAQVNAANHDLVGLLEPLLAAAPTQKRLLELVTRQGALSEAEAADWLARLRQLLEDKRQASQALIRHLIRPV